MNILAADDNDGGEDAADDDSDNNDDDCEYNCHPRIASLVSPLEAWVTRPECRRA